MTRSRDNSLSAAFEEYVQSLDALQSRQAMQTMFSRAEPFLEEERGLLTVDEIEVIDCRAFAKHLSQLAAQGELKARTANTYYEHFRAWLSFCVRDEFIDTNPAKKHRAEEPLPEDPGHRQKQQFWKPKHRNKILTATDTEAENARDELEGNGWASTFRNRAITYVLCYTGGRAGEFLAKAGDPDRTGISWRDVDLEDGSIRVFGKSRQFENMQLPKPAAEVLAEYKAILDPPQDNWPVFPSGAAPALYPAAREQLAERGIEEDERETLLTETDIHAVYREYALVPPSITDDGFRQNFWYDLVEDHDLRINGEMPKFHGARRGLGDELYREKPQLAQKALRHADIKTTHNSYSYIKASETAADVEETIDAEAPPAFLSEDE